MLRLLFTITIFLASGLLSFGQTNVVKDSFPVNEADIKVTLLGTGFPQPSIERFGPSILIQAGGENLLFDAGRGSLQRLRQLNISYDKISALFLTHLHSDHVVGLPDLWLSGWLTARSEIPLKVFGPKGTSEMIKYLRKAFAFDIKTRIEDDKAPLKGSKLLANEIQQGIIFERNGVKVIAFEVDHYPVVPAFGYRVEYNNHSVVLSGDTRYCENLIKFAKGTDLLIHEVVIAPDTLTKSDPRYPVLLHHTTPEQAAKLFNEVKPKMAVYSHIVNLYKQNEQYILKRTSTAYSGIVILGEDLMSISINETVSVNRWQQK